jgi:hypothetical protein
VLSPTEQRKVPERHWDIEALGFQNSRDLILFRSRNTDEVLAVDLRADTHHRIREESGFGISGMSGTNKIVASGIAISRCLKKPTRG